MTNRGLLLVLASTATLVSACSSGGAPRAASTSTPTPAASSARGGLVGTIDQARLLAVCENIRGASTVVDTGMSASEADRFLTGAAGLLQKPPTDAEATALAARIRAEVAAHREQPAVDAGRAFCAKRGG